MSKTSKASSRSRKPKDLDLEKQLEIKEAFDLFVTTDSGKISVTELKVAMRALGFKPSEEELEHLQNEVDHEENGVRSGLVDFPDFLDLMTSRMRERDPDEEIKEAFKLFDIDGTGKITFDNLKRLATELGENMTDDEIREMLTEADRDDDGMNDFEEFKRVMQKTFLFS